jgi:hypothetical protein
LVQDPIKAADTAEGESNSFRDSDILLASKARSGLKGPLKWGFSVERSISMTSSK